MTDKEALQRLVRNFLYDNGGGGYGWNFIPGVTIKDEDPELDEYLKRFEEG